MSVVHLKAIPVFTVELLIFELDKHPLSSTSLPPQPKNLVIMFSSTEPLFKAVSGASRAEMYGEPPLYLSPSPQCD